MANLAWRLSQGKESLASKCIISKYIHLNYVTKAKNGSTLWKGLEMGWNLLNEHTAWSLGDGKNISFWWDKCVDGQKPKSRVIGPLTKIENDLSVRDNIIVHEQWNFQSLTLGVPTWMIDSLIQSVAFPYHRTTIVTRSFQIF